MGANRLLGLEGHAVNEHTTTDINQVLHRALPSRELLIVGNALQPHLQSLSSGQRSVEMALDAALALIDSLLAQLQAKDNLDLDGRPPTDLHGQVTGV